MKSTSRKNEINIKNKKIAIVVSSWNDDITESLFDGAYQALLESGAKKSNIFRRNVPGSFELPLAAQQFAEQKEIDAVICLGCVIQGDTPHFDYICQAVSYGIMKLNLKFNKPVVFGVLTTLNKKQASERSGGKLGNKGEEAAMTAIEMLS